jgi:DNA-binding NtrC family response regulator
LRSLGHRILIREGLYYRLNVFPMQAAALRDRKEDVPLLAQHSFRSQGLRSSKH